MDGGSLKVSVFQALLESSYTGNEVQGFTIDKSISSKETRVYVSNISEQVIVAHTGTYSTSDWGNNAVFALLGDSGYQLTPRYNRAKKIQQKAEKKYGAKNISTIGHSQAGLLAQLLGQNTHEIITLNKATRPQDFLQLSKPSKQYDVRSNGDVVSVWGNPFLKKNTTTIKKKSNNPISEHSPNVLSRLDKDTLIGSGMTGGGLKSSTLRKLLEASYETNSKIDKNIDGYILDNDLSKKTAKVFYNPTNGWAVVAHTGTYSGADWWNNFKFAVGGESAYKLTDRYKWSERVQMKAEKKYGQKNIITIGHSQGGLLAEFLGKNTAEIITLNKATSPFTKGKISPNQTDVRSDFDIVSAPRLPDSTDQFIRSTTMNPLTEHNIDVLRRLPSNQMIGEKKDKNV